MRVLMIGTGEFAVPTFRAVLDSIYEVLALVTQPERSAEGRHRHVPQPMKQLALARGVPVLQPPDVNAPESVRQIAALEADLLVVAAYGQILSANLLSATRLGGINVHASLLPKYRGAAPVNWAIYHGENETGVSIIHMSPALDAGPVLAQRATPIDPDETAGQLAGRLAEMGAELVLQVLQRAERGDLTGTPQDPTKATRARKLRKTDGLIKWHRSAAQVVNQVRAMQPWPGPYTFWQRAEGEARSAGAARRSEVARRERPLRVLLLKCRVAAEPPHPRVSPKRRGGELQPAPPGTVLVAEGARLEVAAGNGVVAVERLQPAGKRVLTAGEFLRGYPVQVGDRFGAESAEDRLE